MKRFVVVLLLVSFLLAPAGSACEPTACDWALETGKVVDWMVCGLVAMMLGYGFSVPGGYYVYYP